MGFLLLRLLPLALATAVSPTLLATSILLLASPVRPHAKAAAFSAGAFVVAVGIGIVGVLTVQGVTEGKPHESSLDAWIDIVLGGILLVLAILLLVTKPKVKPDRAEKHQTGGGEHVAPLFGLGALMMLVNVSSLIPYLAALKETATSDLGLAGDVVGLAMLVFFIMLPMLIPLVLVLVAPGPADHLLGRFDTWMSRHRRRLSTIVAAAIGVYLVVKGVRALP